MSKKNKTKQVIARTASKEAQLVVKKTIYHKKHDQSESAAYKLITKPVSNLHFVNSKKMTNFKKSD